MPPYLSDPSSSEPEDSDSPEVFSLLQSKKTAESQNDSLKKARAAEKKSRKEKNRARDQKLKERAETTKKKPRSTSDEDAIDARMEKAMRDADEETDEEMVSDGHTREISDEDGSESSSASEIDEEEQESDEMASEDSEESEAGSDINRISFKSSNERLGQNYLPEHLFTSAFTPERLPASTSKSTSSATKTRKPVNKNGNKTPKDLILGYLLVFLLFPSCTDLNFFFLSIKLASRPRTIQFLKVTFSFKNSSSAQSKQVCESKSKAQRSKIKRLGTET